MKMFGQNFAMLAVVSAVAAVSAAEAPAGAFVAWKVANVPWGDTLNVRKYPSGISRKQAAYPNGTVLQMTGRCTGGVDLAEVAGSPGWKQMQLVRYRWCEVWHDPSRNGEYVTGWVYGKYIAPY